MNTEKDDWYAENSAPWGWCVRDRTKQKSRISGGMEDSYIAFKLTSGNIARQIAREHNSHNALVAALKEIAKGEGPYNRDPLHHAANTIDAMTKLADDALAAAGETV